MSINAADYDFLSDYLMTRSGLSLGPGKEYLLESRLVPLAQSMGLSSLEDLIKELRRGRDTLLSSAVTEAMTTNETSFFRDKTPFEALRNDLLPALIKAREHSRKLRIWCAASSSGQEPYSVLMVLNEFSDQLKNWGIEVVATDISSNMIARSRAAVYSQFEVQRGLPIQLLMKYFEQCPEGWRIQNELRQRIRFEQLNLLEDFSRLGQFDVIFCRNVLIYFESDIKRSILDRMRNQIRSDGYLVLGAAETVLGITEKYERFRKSASAVYTPAEPSLTASKS